MTKLKTTTPSRFWKPRATRAGKARIEKAGHLWRAACRYFDWTENTPLTDLEAIKFQGEVKFVEVPKMRLMTIDGLLLFLGLDDEDWNSLKGNKEYSSTISRIEKVIKTQNLAGATVGIFNPTLVARELGFTEHHEAKDHALNTKGEKSPAQRLRAILDQADLAMGSGQ